MTQLRVPIWFYVEGWDLLLDAGTELPATKEVYVTPVEHQQETIVVLIGIGCRGRVMPSLGVTIGSLPASAKTSVSIHLVFSINAQRLGRVQAFTDSKIALPVTLHQYQKERIGDSFELDNFLCSD